FLTTTAGEELFFKFHHEEGEEHTLREFYQAELLGAAGYPVDMPLHASREVGRQLLLYRRRRSPRFADLCRRLDAAPEAGSDPSRWRHKPIPPRCRPPSTAAPPPPRTWRGSRASRCISFSTPG